MRKKQSAMDLLTKLETHVLSKGENYMRSYEIIKPVGLTGICDAVEFTCSKAEIFKRSGLKPHHYIIHLDAGQGRTTVLEYIADMYKAYDILDFESGLDDYIELDFDGTYNNFRNGVETVLDAAVYSDHYQGIVGISCSALASHRQETQWTEFNTFIKELSKSANLVFFVDYESSKYDELIINAIKNTISNVDELYEIPYTYDEYACIIESDIEKKGVVIKNLNEFHNTILEIVRFNSISVVKDAISIADEIIQCADFSMLVPTVSSDDIKLLSQGKSLSGGIK